MIIEEKTIYTSPILEMIELRNEQGFATQTYREGGFAEGMNPAVAYTNTNGNLTFKNLCGILQLQLSVAVGTQTIKKITLWSSDSKLSGIGIVAMAEETPTLTMSSTASNSVTLDLGTSGVELSNTAKTFYIVVPATTRLFGSYSVTVYDSDSNTMTKSTSLAINRSKIRPMPELSFSADPISADNVTLITTTSAVYRGVVASDDGSTITARGVVWSTSPNPTIDLDTKTTNGSGDGAFTSDITGLTAGTTYYVRTYATKSDGTFYGEQKTFMTSSSFTIEGVTFDMIGIAAGTFTMGAREEEGNYSLRNRSLPIHLVTLTTAYSIGECEVTQALWKAVMGSDNNPSKNIGDNLPVEQFNWEQCQSFITNLNSKLSTELSAINKKFALPTEAQWEYAARGGNCSKGYICSGSNTYSDVAWNNDATGVKTQPVATKKPNELGIYDMSGNVWEWCSDWYVDGYSSESQTDPTGPTSGSKRVNRGGSIFNKDTQFRVSFRDYYYATDVNYTYGIRLVLVPAE